MSFDFEAFKQSLVSESGQDHDLAHKKKIYEKHLAKLHEQITTTSDPDELLRIEHEIKRTEAYLEIPHSKE